MRSDCGAGGARAAHAGHWGGCEVYIRRLQGTPHRLAHHCSGRGPSPRGRPPMRREENRLSQAPGVVNGGPSAECRGQGRKTHTQLCEPPSGSGRARLSLAGRTEQPTVMAGPTAPRQDVLGKVTMFSGQRPPQSSISGVRLENTLRPAPRRSALKPSRGHHTPSTTSPAQAHRRVSWACEVFSVHFAQNNRHHGCPYLYGHRCHAKEVH